ncbi:fluoride efflux transporter CrcB [Kordiimonas sp. SCSIO 12610]|uniref:fluoride efflux transporter CrcB n=1 Tax=Kordiimonas sp. SCSIO 12610 TaxID=2829597 RepID=UPI00210C49DD|nr:fluoride efflux transporter CrcB [Kordiimonas sp. SCSIO 12610]UTW54297.1 fluoride efflux transporter CrcB [Kordiimonas sp. SCSIO 12610]
MKMILAIALGGASGAVSRHYFAALITRVLGNGFPFGIFFVNILGSFLMGLLITVLAERFTVAPEMRGLIAVGFLGSFTTFSTYSLDIYMMFTRGEWVNACLYAFASMILGVVGLMLGIGLGRIVS